MADNTFRATPQQIHGRLKQVFPDMPETYFVNLVNEALTESGRYAVKHENAKASTVADQMWYNIADNQGIEVNKIYRVSFLDSSDDYVKIPRLVDNEIQIMDLT